MRHSLLFKAEHCGHMIMSGSERKKKVFCQTVFPRPHKNPLIFFLAMKEDWYHLHVCVFTELEG